MKKIVHYTILFICLSNALLAQNNPQQWINFSQDYYKIPTGADGVYRITYDQMQEAGIPLNAIDPRSIQIFHRAQEIAIRVAGESDGSFDGDDYIEFIGKRNTGEGDSPLYMEQSYQPHQFYSLYSDTTAYFLTWKLDGSRGKRMQIIPFQENVNNLTPLSYFLQENLTLYTNQASLGRTYPRNNSTRNVAFDLGEGFSGTAFSSNTQDLVIENLSNVIDGEGIVDILVQGRNNNPHQVEVFIGPSTNNLRSVGTQNFDGFDFRIFNATIDISDINANGSLLVRTQAQLTTAPDRVSVSYVQLYYPRSFNMASTNRLFMTIPSQNTNQAYLEIQNTASGSRLYDITDYDNPKILNNRLENGVMKTVLNNTTSEQNLYIEGPGFIRPEIKPVKFRSLAASSANYLIVTHQLLRQSTNLYADPVKAYASYRASTQGGSYDTLVVTVDQLYDQFNNGEVSPLAIRNFVSYMHQIADPEYLFLVGNGLNWFYKFYRAQNPFQNSGLSLKDFVPPSGHPGSDVAFSNQMYGSGDEPSLATGRLTAQNAQDVENYLEKIKSMEAQEIDALWRKKHVVLSGGLTSNEVVLFRNYGQNFINLLSLPYLGGFGELISKRTNNSIEVINIADRVNEGLQQITFFGHSGTSQTDIDIGFVSNEVNGYNNRDKYPFILINGCNAGEIFSNQLISFGEDWMRSANRGATAVMAHSAEGYGNELRKFSNLFFQTAYGDSAWIHQSLGKVHQEVMRRYIANEGNNYIELDRAQIQQMILQGDPAYRLFPTDKPDFTIANGSVEIKGLTDETVTARSDSFALSFIVKNYGRTVDDTLQIKVNRILPSGERISLPIEAFPPVLYQDTLSYVIRENNESYFGRNLFELIIDPDNQIPEINEQNNSTTFDYFLALGATQNLFPYPFSIVNQSNITLKAQSTDLLSDQREYLIQIDTTANFDSPWRQDFNVADQVLFTQVVQLLSQDSVTYFWRSKFAQAQEGELDEWAVSSFTFIQAAGEGWIQNNIAQIETQEIIGLTNDNGNWVFQENSFTLEADLSRTENSASVSIRVEGFELNATAPCAANTLNLLAFDRSSGDAYRVLSSGGFDVLDPLSCGRRPQVINQIRNNQISQPGTYLHTYLDGIADGDYVLIVSNDSVDLEQMVALSGERLKEIGASSTVMNQLQNGDLYLLFGRKGMNEGEAIELYQSATDLQSGLQLSLNEEVFVSFSDGKIMSRRIGPSNNWQSLYFELKAGNSNGAASLNVYGINNNNQSVLLFSDVASGQTLETVDADQYPYLRLQFETEDTQTQIPFQLDKWQVNYSPIAEGILIPDITFYEQRPAIAEGLDFSFPYRYLNISDKDYTTSLHVAATFTSLEGVNRQVSQSIDSLKAGEESIGELLLSTKGLKNKHNFNLQILPENVLLEHNSSNNILNIASFLNVLPDSLDPVIRVTFDGVSILDGDIVSPNPLITVSLVDENPYLLKQDTSNITLFMKRMCEACEFERINLGNPSVRIIPASEEQDFTLEYRPEELDNGKYVLRVNAADESNNMAGDDPYEISFEVINESSITHFYPYPNPFSSSTRFVFTLTGAEIPDEIKIQIMTVTGRVVREILQDEIGSLRIGNNITEYAWDGRDEFGDVLANGVYLYRVLVKRNGQYIDHRATAADKAFKKGYGKLYILR